MDEQTPRERLRESLRENAERVRAWPEWLRAAISTADIFRVAPVKADAPRRDEPR